MYVHVNVHAYTQDCTVVQREREKGSRGGEGEGEGIGEGEGEGEGEGGREGGRKSGGGGRERTIENSVTSTHHVLVLSTEEPCMMSLLYNNEGDTRFIVLLQLHTGLTYTTQLMLQYLM